MKHYKSPHPREDSSWLNKVYTFPSPFPVPVASKIMIGSKWEVVTKNLKTFLEERDKYFYTTNKRCSVTLQLTFLESNILELHDIVKMAIELGVDRVKGHHLWAHFEEIKDYFQRQ